MIMRNYIAFVVAAGILLLGLMMLVTYITDRMYHISQPEKILAKTSLLQQEKYDQIDSRRYLGKVGYIEVLDENANILYTDNQEKKNSYSVEDLEYIPEITPETSYYVDSVVGKNGKTEILITQYTHTSEAVESDGAYITLSGYAVLDDDRNIISTNIDFSKNQLSEQELGYLYGDASDDTYLQQYTFQTEDGSERHLLIHTMNISDKTYLKIDQVYIVWRPIFVAGLVMLLILFVFFMNKQVKRPLEILQNAMYDFADRKKEDEIIYDGPAEFMQIFDTFHDMSQKIREGEENQRKLEQDKLKMLADISHDLKTPITVIQGYSKAICDGLVTEEKEQQYLNIIYQKAHVLSGLINSFYEYSRLEHPKFQLMKKEGDICEFLREYVAEKYDEMEMTGLKLEVELPEDPVEFDFDKMQMQRVFENILINTIKHNPSGTTIFIQLKKIENEIVIRMGDNGIGIPSEIRQTIFEPFVVGDDSRNTRQGTGLGLAIVRKIVEAHGGKILLLDRCEEGISTMFEIHFSS